MQKNVFCYDVSLGKRYPFILSESICFHDVTMIVYHPRVFRNDITVATVTSPTLQPMSNTPPRQILNVVSGRLWNSSTMSCKTFCCSGNLGCFSLWLPKKHQKYPALLQNPSSLYKYDLQKYLSPTILTLTLMKNKPTKIGTCIFWWFFSTETDTIMAYHLQAHHLRLWLRFWRDGGLPTILGICWWQPEIR